MDRDVFWKKWKKWTGKLKPGGKQVKKDEKSESSWHLLTVFLGNNLEASLGLT